MNSTHQPPAAAVANAAPEAADRQSEYALLDQAFTRAGGAGLVAGNRVRLLQDAKENYPAWLTAIHAARDYIHFENYIFREDATGARFADALMSKARDGVQVRVIHDWMGGIGKTSRSFWRHLRAAGVEVREFNRPRLSSPIDWLHRDHRKMVAVDGQIGFVTGLCVGEMWEGDAAKGIEPWRDTGIEVHGPAVADIERAFARVWAATGEPLAHAPKVTHAHAGDVSIRIVASEPGTAALLRLDQLIAAAARRTLWLTDAYFAGIPPYVQALRAAALDGVDVRLLIPGSSDIPALRPLSQAGFRPLLDAGVRVFEWNGSMLHAKTAVADGRWARVGSSNLNIASWIGNYELDAVVEDKPFASKMEAMYLADLERSTELVLEPKGRRRNETVAHLKAERPALRHAAVTSLGRAASRGSASRAAAGALRFGRSVGAALTQKRVLAAAEARPVAIMGIIMLAIAGAALWWPYVVAIPVALVIVWVAVALLLRAHGLRRERRSRGMPRTRVATRKH